MFCSECGKQVEDNAKFCGECGTVQSNIEQTPKAELNQVTNVASSNTVGSFGISNVAGYVVGAIMLVGLSYITVAHFASDKTETTEIAQADTTQLEQGSNDTKVSAEEKAKLAAEAESMSTASVEGEKNSRDIKEAILRTGGAWTGEKGFKNGSKTCKDVVSNSKDFLIMFISHTNNNRNVRIRVGKLSELWNKPDMHNDLVATDSSNLNLSANIKYENGDAIVDYTMDEGKFAGKVFEDKYRYDSKNDVLEQYSTKCISCNAEEIESMQYDSDILNFKNGGTSRKKYCTGTV